MEEERLSLATYIVGGDADKGKLLLDLIDMSLLKNIRVNELKEDKNFKIINEKEECKWYRSGDCCLDAPDTVKECKGLCSRFDKIKFL